jgi:polyisoprenyl-phosphate glycosyltransferase
VVKTQTGRKTLVAPVMALAKDYNNSNSSACGLWQPGLKLTGTLIRFHHWREASHRGLVSSEAVCVRIPMPSVDIIVPVFNEAQALLSFHESLKQVASGLAAGRIRYIYVNDGSTDGTQELLVSLAESDADVVALELSRNFGHQAALSAGLDYAEADVVVMMDGDGQHPPDLIPEMLRLYELGYDIVQSQRVDADRSLKHLSSRAFYAVISKLGGIRIPEGTADFRLISRKVHEALRSLREYHRFYRGIVPWLGFRTVLLPYIPAKRLAGSSKYSLRKMLRLAGDGVFSFSLLPLRLGIFAGLVFLCGALLELAYVASFWLSGRRSALVPGWSSTIVVLTAGLGAVMILLGFIGIYVGMIFQEVKRRPVYVLRSGAEAPAGRAGSSERVAATSAPRQR